MDILEKEVIYEQKIDDITIQLELLLLDAISSVLNRLIDSYHDFGEQKHKTDVEPF